MYLPSRRRMHHCFLTRQGHNVHIWHQSKFTEDANWNKQKWCYSQSKNFSRASDIVIHLRTFRVIFNGMPVLFWSYVGDLATSMGKCFFQILWPRETQIRVFFFEKIAYDLYNFSLSKLKFSWRSWFQYFNSKIFFRGMRTDLSV